MRQPSCLSWTWRWPRPHCHSSTAVSHPFWTSRLVHCRSVWGSHNALPCSQSLRNSDAHSIASKRAKARLMQLGLTSDVIEIESYRPKPVVSQLPCRRQRWLTAPSSRHSVPQRTGLPRRKQESCPKVS